MKRIVTVLCWRKPFTHMIAFLLTASLSVFPSASALGKEEEVQVLTLEEALRITAEKNRDIQKALE
jgi:hypothetical protein